MPLSYKVLHAFFELFEVRTYLQVGLPADQLDAVSPFLAHIRMNHNWQWHCGLDQSIDTAMASWRRNLPRSCSQCSGISSPSYAMSSAPRYPNSLMFEPPEQTSSHSNNRPGLLPLCLFLQTMESGVCCTHPIGRGEGTGVPTPWPY